VRLFGDGPEITGGIYYDDGVPQVRKVRTCDAHGDYSVAVLECPRCREDRTERAGMLLATAIRGDILRMRGTKGHCIECGERLPRRARGQGMQALRFCSPQCRQDEYNARRRRKL
jgi:hypothetical protein